MKNFGNDDNGRARKKRTREVILGRNALNHAELAMEMRSHWPNADEESRKVLRREDKGKVKCGSQILLVWIRDFSQNGLGIWLNLNCESQLKQIDKIPTLRRA